MNPTEFTRDYIQRWEGGMSRDPNDAGNWSTGKKGVGTLLGSNRGVTGRTLAAYRGVKVETLRMADIEAITLDVATKIALLLFYEQPGISRLSWNRVTASVMDFGWGAGPASAVKMLQDLIDVDQDAKIGPKTNAAYSALLAQGEAFAAGAWWAMREEYYEDLVTRRPSDAIYLKGWDNRSRYFTPASEWWGRAA